MMFLAFMNVGGQELILILLIVLVCAIALISRHRLRVAASLRSRPRSRTNARVDPWVEAGKRLEVDPDPPDLTKPPSEDQAE